MAEESAPGGEPREHQRREAQGAQNVRARPGTGWWRPDTNFFPLMYKKYMITIYIVLFNTLVSVYYTMYRVHTPRHDVTIMVTRLKTYLIAVLSSTISG